MVRWVLQGGRIQGIDKEHGLYPHTVRGSFTLRGVQIVDCGAQACQVTYRDPESDTPLASANENTNTSGRTTRTVAEMALKNAQDASRMRARTTTLSTGDDVRDIDFISPWLRHCHTTWRNSAHEPVVGTRSGDTALPRYHPRSARPRKATTGRAPSRRRKSQDPSNAQD